MYSYSYSNIYIPILDLTITFTIFEIKDSRCEPSFHPLYTNIMCDIIINLSTTLDNSSKRLKTFSLLDGLGIKPHFHIKFTWLNLQSKYSVLSLLNLNPLDSKVFLHASSFALTLPRVSSIVTIFSATNIHHDPPHWICCVNWSINKGNKNELTIDHHTTPSQLGSSSSFLPLSLPESWFHRACP